MNRHERGFLILGLLGGIAVSTATLLPAALAVHDPIVITKRGESVSCSTDSSGYYDTVFLASSDGQEGRINKLYGPFNLRDDEQFTVARGFMALGDEPVVWCRTTPPEQ